MNRIEILPVHICYLLSLPYYLCFLYDNYSPFCFCLTEPNFVSTYEIGDFIYFFFRETAVEYINCGKVVVANVYNFTTDLLNNINNCDCVSVNILILAVSLLRNCYLLSHVYSDFTHVLVWA